MFKTQKIYLAGKTFTAYYTRVYLPVWIQGTIVDVETRGLDPTDSNLTAVGFVKGNKLSAFVISQEHEAEHQTAFRAWSRAKLLRAPRPYVAYYKEFEEAWLETTFDIEIQPKEYQKKVMAVGFWHFKNNDGAYMLFAREDAIMAHLVMDLLEELALYTTLSHAFRDGSFNIGAGIIAPITVAMEDTTQ